MGRDLKEEKYDAGDVKGNVKGPAGIIERKLLASGKIKKIKKIERHKKNKQILVFLLVIVGNVFK